MKGPTAATRSDDGAGVGSPVVGTGVGDGVGDGAGPGVGSAVVGAGVGDGIGDGLGGGDGALVEVLGPDVLPASWSWDGTVSVVPGVNPPPHAQHIKAALKPSVSKPPQYDAYAGNRP